MRLLVFLRLGRLRSLRLHSLSPYSNPHLIVVPALDRDINAICSHASLSTDWCESITSGAPLSTISTRSGQPMGLPD